MTEGTIQYESDTVKAVAPAWHTAIVIAVLLGISAFGSVRIHLSLSDHYAAFVRYAFIVVWEWVLIGFVVIGIRQRGFRLIDLVGGRWRGPMSILRDLGLAVGFLIGSGIVLHLINNGLHAKVNPAARRILPSTNGELAAFMLVSMTAGICEEILFRGYLQRQMSAMTGNKWVGLLIQGVPFGGAHGYEGIKAMLLIAVLGCLLGAMAMWRRSLRPGMMAHFLIDAMAGLAGYYAMSRAGRMPGTHGL